VGPARTGWCVAILAEYHSVNIGYMAGPVKKRAYVSPRRQARAEATRARIIGAAAKLFLQLGYGNTSTAAIGRLANTSEATVFAVFGSKAELLVDVIGEHASRDPAFPLRESPIWRSFTTGQDTTAAMKEFARVVRGAHDRSWQLLALAAAAAHDDPTVATAVARGAAGRHADCGWLLQKVVGITESELNRKTDAVWTMISVEIYQRLVVDRSWPSEQYESWLAEMLTASLR
jgi:hypothetical protein